MSPAALFISLNAVAELVLVSDLLAFGQPGMPSRAVIANLLRELDLWGGQLPPF